jgi:uncharacterized protein (DUF1778 family)
VMSDPITADGPSAHTELPPVTRIVPLSNADRDLFLAALDGPPPAPTDSLKRAMAAAAKKS